MAQQKENDVMVVSYRDHHHAVDPNSKDVTFINRAIPMTAWRRFVSFVFSMCMVHYFLWWTVMLGFVYLIYTYISWYVALGLTIYYYYTFFNGDQYRKGRPWPAFRQHSLWRLTSRYIGVEVVRTKVLDPSKKYMFAMYPHGILILSRIAMYGGVWEKLFPGIDNRVLGASPMFFLPGSREICLWMGAIDAAKRVAVNAMNKYGLNLMVYPGGSDEIFETDPNSNLTTLIARKGFIKLSIQSGASIVPAFVFGEKWLYHRKPVSEGVRKWFMRYLRLPLIIFWGRFFTWLPYHDKQKGFLSVVFGEPIDVKQEAEPSEEYINEIWGLYIKQVEGLYETYKGKFGYPADEKLVIKEAKSERKKHHKKEN